MRRDTFKDVKGVKEVKVAPVRRFIVSLVCLSLACGPISCATKTKEQTGASSPSTPSLPSDPAARQLIEALGGAQPAATVAETKARLDRLFNMLEAADATIPRDMLEVDALAEHVGHDPAALLSWVRNETSLVPYRGTLRGPLGVLLDRRGNSLDRALLLAKLLEITGETVRLAHTDLPAGMAVRLAKDAANSRGTTTAPVDGLAGDGPFVDQFAAESGHDAGTIREAMKAGALEKARGRQQVQARVASQGSSLAAIVRPALQPAVANVADVLRDHWWVQRQDGNRWVDLDPSADGPGHSLGSARETLEVNALSESLRHAVVIRVVAERWDGAAYRESRVLDHRVVPAEAFGKRIELRQMPMNWPTDPRAMLTADGSTNFEKAVLEEHEWLPTLTIDDQVVSQSSVTDTGDVNESPGVSGASTGQDMSGALGGDSEKPHAPGVLTAEWIEYEIQSPGRTPFVTRRELFDIAGPEARAAKRPPAAMTASMRWARSLQQLGVTEILPLAAQLPEAAATHTINMQILASRPMLQHLLEGTEAKTSQQVTDAAGRLKPPQVRLYELATARTTWSARPDTVFLDRPNVLTRHVLFLPNDQDGFHQVESLDIVANEVNASGPEPQSARMEQGILDSAAEGAVAGADRRPGAVDLFDSSWALIRTPDDLKTMAASADVRARMALDLSSGYVLVAPKTVPPGQEAWWRVDPRTGDTVAIGDRGWGQGMTEYSVTKKIVVIGAFTAGCVTLASGASRSHRPTARQLIVCGFGFVSFLLGATIWGGICFVIATGIWLGDNPDLDRPLF